MREVASVLVDDSFWAGRNSTVEASAGSLHINSPVLERAYIFDRPLPLESKVRRSRLVLLLVLGMLSAILPIGAAAPALAASSIFINEIHYDNASSDVGEFVEVAGPAGTDLTGWTVALYNGSASQLSVYATITLSGVIDDEGSGYGAVSFTESGIQNGSPDGLALVDNLSSVIQFLSYEGSFTAGSGPASGMTSVDIGVAEASDSAVGDSLQLTGTSLDYDGFDWSGSSAESPGSINAGQVFDGTPPPPSDPVINEFVANHTGSDSGAFVEVLGDSSTSYSVFTVLEIEGDGSGAGVIDAVLPGVPPMARATGLIRRTWRTAHSRSYW